MGPEKRITESIRARLRTRPRTWFVKIAAGAFQVAGLPDLIGCTDGRFFALEVKVPGGRATALQSRVLELIRAAGGIAEVVTSADEAEAALAVWQCDDCRAAHPDLAPESWQFVNKSGECPRCAARTAATEDNQ
jgi:hypothetical protein